MGSTIKLVFQTIAAGSGLAEINAQTGAMQKKLGKLGQGFSTLGAQVGGAFGKIASGIGMLATGGIWGALIMAGTAVVGKVTEMYTSYRKLRREANLAARGISAEWLTADYAHKQYLKRLDEMRAKARQLRDEEEAAAKAEEAAAKAKIASRNAAMKLERDYYSLEEQIAQEKIKQGLSSGDELTQLKAKIQLMAAAAKANVADKQRAVAHAEERFKEMGGSGGDLDIARKELELAKAKAETTKAEAQKLLDDYKARQEAAKAEADAKLEAMRREDEEQATKDAKRKEAEEAIARIRKNAAEAVAGIEAKIAAKKQEAADWEENAKRARGVNFGDWDRGERDRAHDAAIDAKKQAKREAKVDQEIAQIEAMSPRARSKWHKERLAKLRQWRDAQNPANNAAADEVAALQKKAAEIAEKSEAHLAKIEDLMKSMGL
jgi:colicin import membrane protein